MSAVGRWMSQALLRAPASVRSLRGIPVLGRLIHGFSHRLIHPDEKVWARIESGPAKGLWIELNPRTGQSYARGETEIVVQKFIASRIKPGDVFYDLGANIGLFTLIAARSTGLNGKVFSFEPDPANATRLRRNVAKNGFDKVSIQEVGIWSSTTELTFAVSPLSSPDRGVGTFMNVAPAEQQLAVHCVSLDDFAAHMPPPTGVKCDVEGAEFEVVKGARTTLSRHRPWLLFEMHSPENNRDVLAFLAEFGYSFKQIDETHVFASP